MISRKALANLATATLLAFALSAFSLEGQQALPLERLLEQVESNPELGVELERTKSRQARLDIVESGKLPSLHFSGDSDLLNSNDEQRFVTATMEQTIIDWGAAVCCNVCVRVVLLVTAPESVHSSSKTTQDNAYMRSARKKWLQRTDMHKDGVRGKCEKQPPCRPQGCAADQRA